MGKATDGTKEEEEGGGGALGDGRIAYRCVAGGLQRMKRRGRCRGGEVRGGGCEGGGEATTVLHVEEGIGGRCRRRPTILMGGRL